MYHLSTSRPLPVTSMQTSPLQPEAESGVTDEGRERYRAASELAYRYCGYLEQRFLRPSRLQDLAREARRFYRLGQRDKLERIADLP